MTAPLDLEAIEAAARAPMSFDRPKINCTHDEERGHAPWCFACDVADRASRPVPFGQRGRGDVIRLVAEVRRLRADNDRLDDATRGALNDLARVRGELDAARAASREYLAAVDERDKARRAPAQKGSYLRLVEAQDRLDAAREALRKITEEDGR